MPVTFHVHPCRSARERQLAHDVERKLDLKHSGLTFWDAHARVKSALPTLKRNNEHCRDLDMVVCTNAHGHPVATVFDLGRPFITLTLTEQ